MKKYHECPLWDLWDLLLSLTQTPFVFLRQVSLLTFPSPEGDYIYFTSMLKMCVCAKAALILY